MPLRILGILLVLASVGCSRSITEVEAIAIAEKELQSWQPVPNVAELQLTAERDADGVWEVQAVPGPGWMGPRDAGFPFALLIDRHGNVVARM